MSRSKKRRAEDRDCGSSSRSDCRYEGCRKPTLEAGRGFRHQFCGWTHRDFFMAHLAELLFDHGETHETGNAMYQDRCKLPGCEDARKMDSEFEGHKLDYCRKAHALKHIEECTRNWTAKGRLCQFYQCTHHVWVDQNSNKCEDFCSFEHAKLAAAARGLAAETTLTTNPVKSIVDDGVDDGAIGTGDPFPQSLSQDASLSLQVVIDSRRGYDDDKDLESLLEAASLCHPWKSANADPSGKLVTGINPINFHPFELVTGFSPRFFLWFIDNASQSTQRSTKEGFGWKQTSGSHCSGRLISTYFFYEWKQGTKNDHLSTSDLAIAYRQFQDTVNHKNSQKKRRHRWKMHQIWPSEAFAKEINQRRLKVGLETMKGHVVIYKIFQDPRGEPVWPPLLDHEDYQFDDLIRLFRHETPTTAVLQGETTAGGLEGSPTTSTVIDDFTPSATDESNVLQRFGEIDIEDLMQYCI